MRTKVGILNWKYSIYSTFKGLGIYQKLIVALAGAALVGLLSVVRIPLPFTPVPLTLQVFGVLITGLFMGSTWGAISMLLYVLIGALGMPWFSGATGGTGHLLGVTGGYIVGFIVASYIAGKIAEKIDTPIGSLLAALVGIGVIYTMGTVGLVIHGMPPVDAIYKGVLPFIAVDLVKGIFAGGFSSIVR